MKHIKTFESMFDFFKKSKPTQSDEKQEVVASSNPMSPERQTFSFGISDFAKFVKFCKEKKIYDILLAEADKGEALIGDNMKNEAAWKYFFRFDLDGQFKITFENGEVYYALIDANNASFYPLYVEWDEKLKKYVRYI